jgi:non-heme Fe2+,alpha-ketoglutarate-dependent halogenase
MPKCLTPAQIEQYREEGCVFPIRIMSETAATELRGRLEAFERRTGGPLQGDMRHKSHLLFTWLAELVRRSSILDTVEDLHGPDLLCWTTNFFIKEAADPAFVSCHQDSTYWGLSTQDVVTAWVAFTEATEANGAMEYIPGSQKLDQIPHRDTFARHNLLTRGQEVMVEVDRSQRRIITLRPGEMSLHHVRLVHGSPPNPSNDRRIGFAIRYIPTMVGTRTVPPSYAARIATTISSQSRSRLAISTRNSSHFTARLPSATPRSFIAAPTSPATTSRRRGRNAVEPAPTAG